MKKTLSLLLTLCLLLSALPTQVFAYVGDIWPASDAVKQTVLNSGSLALQNEYLRVIARWDGTLSTTPAADGTDPTDRQTPNGTANAIQAEYDLTVDLGKLTVSGATSVYYEIVQLKEDSSSKNDTWGVLVSVDNVKIDEQDSQKFFQTLNTDVGVFWGYTLDGFTGMGHKNATDSPVIKMNHTVYDYDTKEVLSTENSVITGKVEDMRTWQSFSHGGDWCYDFITEVYTDGYAWANPFVGLSEYYKKSPIESYLPDTVSVTPAGRPGDTRVECVNDIGLRFEDDSTGENSQRFLWGFRKLVAGEEQVPSAPDAVDPSIYAKRLAAFAVNGGVTVEYVADDAALETLKKRYGTPVALISGDYKSTNGASFEFTGGAAMLSPSVTATWNGADENSKLVIHRDGTMEQQGVSLNAPSFKFYQPKPGAESKLEISLTKDGFAFGIDPEKNEVIVFVDIPYATVKLEQATADAAGNLVLGGEIGFKTVFEGASFTLEELGYGLNDKNEFTVNGVHAKGSFDTAKTLSLELAEVEGEVNTFKGKEKYAFKLELNAFDLFETEAELELVRSKKDGSLLPNTLYFYVAASPGIPLIPPVPIGQLNGGGAGFSNLADTVNGDYFAIPPLKLRGTLKGTYLHLIEGKGDVVLGPSEISLKASDVGLVGVGKYGQIIDSFGYSLQLNGQEREYRGTKYKGVYFVGSEELELNLPNKEINAIVLDSSIKLGAFGGVNDAKNRVYLGIGANGTVGGRVQIPKNIRYLGGLGVNVGNINLIMGGQTTFPISKDTSVSEGMKQAFKNVDVYLGAMVEVGGWLASARVWVLVPKIVETNFRMGGGWDIEVMAFGYLPEWDWSKKGVEPVVQSMPAEDGEENIAVLFAAEPLALEDSETWTEFDVTAGEDETPYILLAFANTVTEQQIKDTLSIKKKDGNDSISINWVGKDGQIDPNAAINAGIDLLENNEDGKSYRVAMLRLSETGTYEVNTGALELVKGKSKDFAVTPFENLELDLTGNQVSGEIKYAEKNTRYVLRTYFAEEKGGADYLIDEQTVEDPKNIQVNIHTTGALVPTGDYYVTSFLMMEKTTTVEDEDGNSKEVTALAAIDNEQFSGTISYTNTNQPKAPTNVTLEATGNEVMRAAWDAVEGANGYRVTIYQRNRKGEWINTGFGYDLDKNTTSIDMALTVGGKGTEESPNLSAKETYKVGVSAYRTMEGGKYYSAEAESRGEYLPEYTPLEISLAVNSEPCAKDANGVFHVCVGVKQMPMLQISCDTENVTYRVTRMDRDTDNEIELGANEEYPIPDFSGTLMLCVEGQKEKDVTRVFLLVSRDETAPVLTLSDPIFFADKATGEYTVTGTADAGSQVFYNATEFVRAAGDGSFAVPGKLDERQNSSVISLYAQDSVGNQSAPQLALITKQVRHSVAVKGSYAKSSGEGTYAADSTVTISAGTRSGYTFSGYTFSGYTFSGYTFSGWTSDSGVTCVEAVAHILPQPLEQPFSPFALPM